jgi:hypothetical protein
MIDLTFTVRRLLIRDELVLKSIIRILHGQTKHNWLYTPEFNADLVIVGPALVADDCPDSVLAGCVVMKVGASELAHQSSTVSLRVGDVLASLNGFGEQVVAARGTRPSASIQQHDSSRDEHYALLRWPDWALMQENRAYMRIATVLAARPVSLRELANKADAETALCVEFLRKLHERNLIRASTPAAVSVVKPSTPTQETKAAERSGGEGSLWARIRNRLGIVRESKAT